MFVTVHEYTPQFFASGRHTPGDDERCIAEIDEPDFTTLVDPPAMSELGRETRLTTMRDLGIAGRCHW